MHVCTCARARVRGCVRGFVRGCMGKKIKHQVARSQRLPAQALVDETRVLQRVVAVVFLEKHHDPAFPSFTQEQQWTLRKMCKFSKSRIKSKTKEQDNNAWMPGLESA